MKGKRMKVKVTKGLSPKDTPITTKQLEAGAIPPAHAKQDGPEGDTHELFLDSMVPAPGNRTEIDAAGIVELARDIKARGVLCPILVRGSAVRDAVPFEIVFGVRRWRACKVAGLRTIPAREAALTDEEARAARLAENLQREDLSALDEAAAFQEMIASGDCTAETLAEKIHKSRSHVFARLALLDLEKTVAAALRAGKIQTSVAELLGRLPKPTQPLAMKSLAHNADDEVEISYRWAKEEIEREFMIDLKKRAGWDLKDEKVCDGTPSCEACPKRSGNLPEKPFKNPYVCTDSICFKRKAEAHASVALAAAKERGLQVLSAGESAKVFRNYSPEDPSHESGYVKAKSQCYQDANNRTYGAIAAAAKPKSGKKIELVAAMDGHGAVQMLYRRKEVEAFASRRSSSSSSNSAEAKRRKEREKLDDAARLIAVDRIVKLLAAHGGEPKVEKRLWQVLIAENCRGWAGRQSVEQIAKRRGLKAVDLNAAALAKWEMPALRGLYAELTICHPHSGYLSGVAQSIAKALGVDWQACVKAAKAAKEGGRPRPQPDASATRLRTGTSAVRAKGAK